MEDAPQPRPRRPRPLAEVKPFAMLYLGEAADLARTLSLPQLRVVIALTRQMAYNDSFTYSTSRVAEELGMFPQKVSAAITQLREIGVLLHVGPERNRVYINPRFFWHGDRRGRAIAITRLLQLYPAGRFIPSITDEDLAAINAVSDLPDTEPTPEEDR